MHETNFLYISTHTELPSEFKIKTLGNSESLPESVLLLISMCHQHLCEERLMTGTGRVQQLP